jgi:4-amino-4-deoxy-L-arabinose transferase-like glycosyltransferase
VVLFLVVSAPFVLAMLLGSLLPSTDFDVNEYHFEGPKEYFQAGRISFLEHNVYTSFPFGTEMLTLLAMVLRDDWYRGALAGKCVLMGFGPLTSLALYAAGRRWFGPIAGLSAAFLYLANPWTYRISTIAYAEGGVSFYLFATLLAVMLAFDCRREGSDSPIRTLLLAGVMAAAAMSCKYPALVSVVFPLGVAAGVFAWQTRGQSARSWQLVLAYTAGAALVIGPWLLKNLIETGNPVYPLAYKIFGGRDWDATLNARWRSGHSPATYALSSLFELARDVTYRSDWISPLLFGLAPAGLFAHASRDRAGWLVTYVGWLFFSCWLFTHRIDRFWVPLLPVVALLAGAGLSWWWAVLKRRGARTGLVIVVVVMAAYHLEFMTGIGGWCGYNDYLRDLDEASQVAASVTAPEIVYLNEHLPAGAKVLAVGDAEMFVAQFPVVYNTVFDRSIMENWLGASPGEPGKNQQLRAAGEIREKLKAEGITHVYVNWLEILRYRSPGNYGYTPFVTPERFADLQELGILGPAWSIPEATMDLERLDSLWVPELEEWGSELITRGSKGASFVTFQVFPVSGDLARPFSGN